MCGIFGFALRQPLVLTEVFRLLEKLEFHQYLHELNPVGGYGAGVAVLKNDGSLVLEKVGKISDSPVRSLAQMVKVAEASVLVGHVRMPSPQFMETAQFREAAQPYVAECYNDLTIVSTHNGNVTNYREIKVGLDKAHVFESEKIGLIDSEVIPHLFEKLLKEEAEANRALNVLFMTLEESNSISLLQIEEKNLSLHFIHKGKTRGLTVWTNAQGEIIFCSRKEPLIEVFGSMLDESNFKEKVFISYHKDVDLQLSFPLVFRVKG